MKKRIRNNYDKCLLTLENVNKLEYKPTLLLHSCCGPCASWPLVLLEHYFDITIYYNNNNIYPESEHTRREQELIRFVNNINNDYGCDIKVITVDYEHNEYMKELRPYHNDKEGGFRCIMCYSKRFKQAAEYASNNGFEYIGTAMTSSRQKNANVINDVFLGILKDYPNLKYLPSDFKKGKGMDWERMLVKKYNMYNQDYCGCEYSIRNK